MAFMWFKGKGVITASAADEALDLMEVDALGLDDVDRKILHTIIDNFGGIMPGQLLFTSDPDGEALVFCAWWPWGNGETISIRLAPFYLKPDSDKSQGARRLKEWFGIKINP